MKSKTRKTTRRLMPLAMVLVALGVAACGSNSSSSSSTSAPASTQSSGGSAATSSSSYPGGSTSSSSGGIPQGANAGDADADNHGGPSDGDGNL